MFFALLPTFRIASSSHLQILNINVTEIMLSQATQGACLTSALTFRSSLSLFLDCFVLQFTIAFSVY